MAAESIAKIWASDLGVPSLAAAYYADKLRLNYHASGYDMDALNRALNGRPQDLLETWMRELGWQSEASHGRTVAPIKQLAAWFIVKYGADQKVVHRYLLPFLEEVSVYFDPMSISRRQAVWTEISMAINLHRPRIIIAHSLGSVAAYETLWHYPRLEVELLITVGSPLAFPDRIFPLLQPPPIDNKGSKPPGVRRWINIADPGDLVAMPPGLAEYFCHVDLDIEVSAGLFFTHKASSYLATKTLRDIVRNHLQLS